jgi:hypothetical protein
MIKQLVWLLKSLPNLTLEEICRGTVNSIEKLPKNELPFTRIISPEAETDGLATEPPRQPAYSVSSLSRYSVGDWPSNFLKMRLKCVRD